jgi:phage N-6-adenine-methyltransferase
MSTIDVHFSSQTDLWATPQSFFDSCNRIFHFTVDVCATPENAKCARYFTQQDDGLAQEWTGSCWMNPPYGRTIGEWMRKAYESSKAGATVVCLVPARPDTKWWHDYATQGKILFWPGRLKFGDSKNSAPFPSAIVVYETVARTLSLQRCAECDGIFIAERSTAKTCSGACRVRLHRERRAA